MPLSNEVYFYCSVQISIRFFFFLTKRFKEIKLLLSLSKNFFNVKNKPFHVLHYNGETFRKDIFYL